MDNVEDRQWQTPTVDVHLSINEVHIWSVPLERSDHETACLAQILTDEEQARARAFIFEKDRRRWTVAHATLRLLLGRYLQADPRALRFVTNEYGKPALAPSFAESHLHFNLSHSGTLALSAFVYEQHIGVDVEYMRPGIEHEELATHFFSARECAALHTLPEALREEAFFLCWTRKEAYIKARGLGLSLPLNQFDVSLTPDAPALLLESREEPQAAERWSLHNLAPGPRYAGALAVEGFNWELRCWRWTDQLFPG